MSDGRTNSRNGERGRGIYSVSVPAPLTISFLKNPKLAIDAVLLIFLAFLFVFDIMMNEYSHIDKPIDRNTQNAASSKKEETMIRLIQIHRRFKILAALFVCIFFSGMVLINIFHPLQAKETSRVLSSNLPFGSFDTPLNGATAAGSIPVTGWALDDKGIAGVKIYRQEGKNLVYIGDAVFVEGARPDVAAAFPGYPDNTKAGWGYMVLTHFLPDKGNGIFTFHAIATDIEGTDASLGTKTVTIDNANSVKPFGALDTPAQGGTASGSNFINWGWALTPQPNHIPIDGSTINVYVDGINLGHPNYNIYRSDIAAAFPSYANSNGAMGYYTLDTTAYENGVHTISWVVRDSNGNTDGIGSRYFTINNQETWHPPTTAQEWLERPVSGAVVEIGYGGPDDIDNPPIPTKESFQDLKGLGAKVVAIEFQYGWTIKPPYKVVEAQYAYLSEALDNAASAGLYSIVSVRNGPGRNAMMPGIEDSDVITTLYEDTPAGDAARAAYIAMLKDMVSRYIDREDVIAWEPLVEPALDYYRFGGEDSPYPQASAVWNPIAESFINAMRSVDARRPILIEPVNWGGLDGFILLRKFADDNVIYTLHTYEPYLYTHQETAPYSNTYPGWYWGEYVDKDTLDKWLKPVDDFQAAHNVPILVGEWGGMRWVPNMKNYIADQLDLFWQRGWSWTYYAWYDGVWEERGFELQRGTDRNSTDYDPDNPVFKPIVNAWQE